MKKIKNLALVLGIFAVTFFMGSSVSKAAKITYDANAEGVTGSTADTQLSAWSWTGGCTANAKENGFIRVGYTFSKWNSKADGTGVSKTPNQSLSSRGQWSCQDTTLYAQWTANEYTVTFDTNAEGVTVTPATKNVTYDETYGVLPEPERTGYIFDGWYTAETEGTKVESTTKVEITAAQTLYAHWTHIPFEITVVGADNATVEPEMPYTVYYGQNKVITLKAKPGYVITSVKVNGGEELAPLPESGEVLLENITEDQEIVVVVEKETYTVLEGLKQKYEGKVLSFRFSGDLELFVRLLLNGEELDEKYYTVESGSTIVKLSKEYTDTLEAGTYEITAEYANGNTASTTFTVEKVENPKTVDNIILEISIGLVSMIGLAGIGLYLKKRFN